MDETEGGESERSLEYRKSGICMRWRWIGVKSSRRKTTISHVVFLPQLRLVLTINAPLILIVQEVIFLCGQNI